MKKHLSTILLFFSLLGFISCEREFDFRGSEEGLSFSNDTVMFDTIFSSIGSTTQNFRVYNPYNEDLTITNISLAGGEESNFRINVNGFSDHSVNEIPIRARDSLYIFVDVTINPSGDNEPFIVTDSILFETSQRIQSVKLIAYGQDIVLMKQEWLETQHLTKEKPYLIYDYLVVDSAQTVTIDPGARLYFYKDASLLVLGTLNVEGTTEEPVLFASHRLEDWYADVPGQWGYIHLLPGSGQSSFDNAIIRNGLMGILADSVGENESPIEISNTKIEHISTFGLLAESSVVNMNNGVIGQCGNSSVALTVGGEYEFSHCTFTTNEYLFGSRNGSSIFLNNYYKDENGNTQVIPLKKANFNNCIIYGSFLNELDTDFEYRDDEFPEADVNYKFDHSLLKLDSTYDTSNENIFVNTITDKAPNFINTEEYNYQLDTLSPAKDVGKRSIAEQFPVDILNMSRLDDDAPDLGAYERQERKDE
ncbi:hypothetical protein [Carboxylicivirga linearis]|uniref:Right-handed parallel beta-helix repeat-containing protein n=1 Tax=Carboxylicivirga linearis TaxID=1628157 RepID=A0ABS5JYB8_9BACT|nr:hypothetical protein [Carboxylicivirga linearis]MBS2099914.1 hypothetical protein [Carboxylicivirga linearis]